MSWAMAPSMSCRYFLASSRIKQRPGPFDRLSEVWIFDGRGHDQIDTGFEESFEGFQEAEIGVGVGARRKRFELDEEVESLSPGRYLPAAAEPKRSNRCT